jgi:hypothetical protein
MLLTTMIIIIVLDEYYLSPYSQLQQQQLTAKRRSAWEGSFELFDATQACQCTSRVTNTYKKHILFILALWFPSEGPFALSGC